MLGIFSIGKRCRSIIRHNNNNSNLRLGPQTRKSCSRAREPASRDSVLRAHYCQPLQSRDSPKEWRAGKMRGQRIDSASTMQSEKKDSRCGSATPGSCRLKRVPTANKMLGTLLGVEDTLGSLVIPMHDSYVENIELLLRLGFLQKIVYDSRIREYERALLAAFSMLKQKRNSWIETMRTIIRTQYETWARRKAKILGEEIVREEAEILLNVDYYLENDPEKYAVYISIFNHPLLFS